MGSVVVAVGVCNDCQTIKVILTAEYLSGLHWFLYVPAKQTILLVDI